MRTALVIAANDLRQRLRDRSALLVAFVVPLALAAVFSLTLGDISEGGVRFRLGIVDGDRGAASRPLVGVLDDLGDAGVVELERVATAQDGRQAADTGRLAAVILVPAGFTAAVDAGAPAQLDVVGDVDAPIGTLVARSIAEGYAGELAAVRISVTAALRAGAQGPGALAARASALAGPLAIEDSTARQRELDPKTFYAAGMAVFFLFFTVQFGISSLLAERRDGTLGRMLVAPIRRASILAGKALTSLVLGLASMGTLAVSTSLLLGATWGDPAGVVLLVVAGVVAATGVTALVATLARTPEQAGYWQSIVALVLGMLGGTFFPLSQAGGWLERASLLTPHAWFLRGLGELSGGAGVGAVLAPAAVIVGFGAVTGALAALRLPHLVEA